MNEISELKSAVTALDHLCWAAQAQASIVAEKTMTTIFVM